MHLSWDIVEDPERVAPEERRAWDDLAVAAGLPFCAPGWLEPWWRHAAPPGAGLRLVMVRDGGLVVGIGAFHAPRPGRWERWRPLGARACERVQPLAAPGREDDVAVALARAMAASRAASVAFEGVPAAGGWPERLQHAWPGTRRPRLTDVRRAPALTIALDAQDFDGWYRTRTAHFRQRLRRSRRALEELGGRTRLATDEDMEAALRAFVRLHRARRAGRGEPTAVTPAVEAMLLDVGRALPAGDRLRVWSVEAGDTVVASSVVLVAGREVAYWLNGFDAAHAGMSPARLAILGVIEDAFALGARRLDLGAGDAGYKRRFAGDEEALAWRVLVAPGPAAPLLRLEAAARRSRLRLGERLDPETKARIRRLASRRRRPP